MTNYDLMRAQDEIKALRAQLAQVTQEWNEAQGANILNLNALKLAQHEAEARERAAFEAGYGSGRFDAGEWLGTRWETPLETKERAWSAYRAQAAPSQETR